ncbi:MAG: STAS domain-containing protein [Thiohalomonadaceae bacterium]|jgi:anti-anti-sigma factor
MQDESGSCNLRLEGEMTIFTAADIRERLFAPLPRCQQIDVDLSQVSELDSAGLQLMVLAKREATILGKEIRFVGHSPAVLDVLELCGLTGYFGDPVVMARGDQK